MSQYAAANPRTLYNSSHNFEKFGLLQSADDIVIPNRPDDLSIGQCLRGNGCFDIIVPSAIGIGWFLAVALKK